MNNKYILFISFMYFLILFSIAIFVKDIAIQFNNMIFLTPSELSVFSGPGDNGTFIRTALDISHEGWTNSRNQWVFNLWPPGFVLLETLIIKIFGTEVPIILVLQILASILFSSVLTLFYMFASHFINKRVAFILPLFIFIFPVGRAFLLEPLGISYGESFAIGFFMLFILLSIYSIMHDSIKYALLAGVFLGLSTYFRSNFGAILLMIIAVGILFIFIYYIFKILKDKTIFKKIIVTKIITILFAAIVICIPWKVYKYIHNGSIKSSVLQYKTLVRTNEDLRESKGTFIITGRGNMMCLVDESTCGRKDNNALLLIKTFLLNPVSWYSIKGEVIGNFWFAPFVMHNPTFENFKPSLNDLLLNWSILIILLFVVYMNIKLKKNIIIVYLTWVNISLIAIYSMIFTVAHYQVRYFYFPKIIIIFMFLILVVLFYKEKFKIEKKKI